MIIGVLLLVSLPIYNGVQDHGKELADRMNARNLNQATMLWEIETGQTVASYFANNNDASRLMEVLIAGADGKGPWMSEEPVDPWGNNRSYAIQGGKWQPLGKV